MMRTHHPEKEDLHAYLDTLEQAVFFLGDCKSALELDVIQRWLHANLRESDSNLSDISHFMNLGQTDAQSASELDRKLSQLGSDTLIIPLRVLWLPGETHRLNYLPFVNPHNPGRLMQSLILRFAPHWCTTVFGEPATVGQLKNKLTGSGSPLALADYVVRQAVLTLKQVERSMRGRRYKEPEFVESDILQDREFQNDLKAISQRNGKPPVELEKEAQAYIKELIPKSTPMGLDLLIRLSRFVYTRGYEKKIDCDPQQIEKLRKLAEKHPVVLLCNHRSQVDSFAIYSALYDNDLPHPHTFGGINMKMPMIGNIMKSSGMIFIRRAFSDNPVYKSVLQRYIDYLVSKRFPLLWSIEGGRSRTGKLLPPRYGLLGWLLNAAERYDKSEPLYIIPLSIVFDQVADISAYTHEQLGGTKKPENLSWFYNYLSSFKTPHGKIYIRFGDPVQASVDAGQPKDPIAVERLAFETCVQLNNSTPVTMSSLVCASLLAAAPQALTQTELCRELELLLSYLKQLGRPATFDTEIPIRELLHSTLPALGDTGIVQFYDGGIEPVYSVADNRALDAAYYKNNAIHFFFTGAIADLALAKLYLEGCGEDPLGNFEREVLELRKLFQWEFFFPEKKAFLDSIFADLDIRQSDWRALLEQGKEGLRTLFLTIEPLTGHAALEPYLDAYRIVAEQLCNLATAQIHDKKAFVQDCLETGKQLYLQRQVVSSESIAKAMFETGIKVVKSQGLLDESVAEHELRELRLGYAEDMRNMSRRARTLRSLASARRSGILS